METKDRRTSYFGSVPKFSRGLEISQVVECKFLKDSSGRFKTRFVNGPLISPAGGESTDES